MGTGSSRSKRSKSAHREKYETLSGHTGGINCMDISDSGDILLTGSDDRTGRVWDLVTYSNKVVLEGHTGYVTCCKIFQERFALTGSMDKSIRKWNMVSGNCILKMEEHRGKVNRLLLFGYFLFSTSYDRTAICWDVRVGQPVRILRSHKQGILPLIYVKTKEHDPRGSEEISRNNDVLVTGSMDCTAKLWSIKAGSTLSTFRGHKGAILCLAADGDRNWLFTGSSDFTIKMWNLSGGTCVKNFEGHEGSIISIELTRKLLYSASIDGTARCWVTEFADTTRRYCGHEHMISDMKYHDGLLTTCSGDNTIKIFDAKSGTLKRTLKGHKYAVNCFVVINTLVISGSYDGTVKIWNIHDLVKDRLAKTFGDDSDQSSTASSTLMSSSRQWQDQDRIQEDELRFPDSQLRSEANLTSAHSNRPSRKRTKQGNKIAPS